MYISSSFSFLFLDHQHEGLYNTFQVPGSTPSDFKKLILSPGVKTEREETLERTSKVLENYQNSFLAISVFVTQMTNCCRKMNESYRDIFFGCKNSCPIHCVHEKAVKVRPGKFKMWPKRSASAADGGGATDRLHKQLYARWDHTHLSGWGVQDNSFLRDQQLRPGKPLTIV